MATMKADGTNNSKVAMKKEVENLWKSNVFDIIPLEKKTKR